MQKFKFHGKDLTASVVVFLVALPLCMGIAIASGAPPALGLLTGIVGGLVVGFIGGAPLQVSGPAAGLTVLVWDVIQKYGLEALGVAVLACGAIQLAAGAVHLGRWFRAVSPAVIQGMLSGIGIIIAASQFHVMLDDDPQGNAVQNIISIPAAIVKAISNSTSTKHHIAAAVGITTIVLLLVWNRFRPDKLSALPGALVGVIAATVLTHVLGSPIKLVDVPASIGESLNTPPVELVSLFQKPAFIGEVLGFALIASAETLLCATAVDRMHEGPRANYDRELCAQGVGNMVCGVLGALPMTGVIVRSSANVEAGAKTRASAILHGVWLLGLVGAAPFVLETMPTASLAAILVYTGWRLINVKAIRELWSTRRDEAAVLLATMVTITVTDLLTGVLTGLGLAMGKLLLTFSRLSVEKEPVPGKDNEIEIWLKGAATFLSLPKLTEALESIPRGTIVYLHVGGVAHVDHAALEALKSWDEKHRKSGGEVHADWEAVQQRTGRFDTPQKEDSSESPSQDGTRSPESSAASTTAASS